jgi:hypothetical protein
MPVLVRCLAQDTNAVRARQARHLASLDFDLLGEVSSRLKAGLQPADLSATYLPFHRATLSTRGNTIAVGQLFDLIAQD